MGQANTNINQHSQEKPGNLELEEYHHEGDLHQRKDDCQKNTGHEGLIPVKDLTIEHLPESFRDQLYLDYIMALISLTVRLVVSYVSCDRPRPSRLPWRKIHYPLSQYRGKHVRAFGSGRVLMLYKQFTDVDGESCPCPQCEKLDDKDRKKQWWKFGVITEKHVVFDDEESRHTQVDVDYNTDTDRDTCPKLHGVEMDYSNMESDVCVITVVSHDRDVCLMLEERLRCHKDLLDKLKNKYGENSEANSPPKVYVSHPHGRSKHVSLGGYRRPY